jgi:hypothetical protein
LRWNRSVKVWPVRVSSVVQVVPSAEPSSVQSRGSRSGASFAEVSVYRTAVTARGRVNVSVAVGWNASHFVPGFPSTRFSFTSPGGFSAVAVTWVSRPTMLRGVPRVGPEVSV